MKRLLITLVFAMIYTTTSAQASQGKIYFPDYADLSITDDLTIPCRNICFSPLYKTEENRICRMGRYLFNSSELQEANGLPTFDETDLTGLSFMTSEYYVIERAYSPSTRYKGMGLGLTGIEINEGTLGYAVEDYLGYQFRVELGLDVSQNTVLTAEYRYLGFDQPDVFDPHGFVFGARFLFD